MTLLVIILNGNYFLESFFFEKQVEYQTVVTISLFVLAITFSGVLIVVIRRITTRRINQLKDMQLIQLMEYTHQIETMYEEIKSFRHDYSNILLSMDEGLKANDLVHVKEVFNRVVKPSGDSLRNANFTMAKLTKMLVLEVKSILISKIIIAQTKKIDVMLEIEDFIANIYIDIIDYCRIVSILLDNAIEAAELSDEHRLSITFIQNLDNKEQIIIISNSMKDTNISIEKIYTNGFSTKGKNRGLGLYNVDSLLSKYNNASLDTQINPHQFTQKLTFKVADLE